MSGRVGSALGWLTNTFFSFLTGLAVGAVDASGAAARAGIQTGDLLLRADGRPLAKSQDLLDLVRSAKRGQVVAIDLLRAGRPLRVSVRLD